MDVFGVPPAVDDQNEQHVGGQHPDGEKQHDEGLHHVPWREGRKEGQMGVAGVGAAAILEGWRNEDGRFVMHFKRLSLLHTAEQDTRS